MKNKKMNLGELKVKSFVTELGDNKPNTAKGGASGDRCGGVLTVVTFGYWSYCCGDSGFECNQ